MHNRTKQSALAIHRAIGGVARIVAVVAITALLAACAVPGLYGPYYKPIYPGIGQHAGIIPLGKSPAPPNRLWIDPGDRRCRFTVWADADEANLILNWEWLSHRNSGGRCMVSNAPLLIEDLDTGRQISISRLRLIHDLRFGAPRLDVHKQVDLASLIPSFGAASPSERRYTLSLELAEKGTGALPSQVTIQLPELEVGGRLVRPPALTIQRCKEITDDVYEYVPILHTRLLPSIALAEFAGKAGAGQTGSGSFQAFFVGTYGWYDEPNVLRLASTFDGFPYVYTEDWKKDRTQWEIQGHIHVEVLSGEKLRLAADTVTWRQTAQGGAPIAMPVSVSHWKLAMYTPARLRDSFERFVDGNNRPWESSRERPLSRQLLAVIPGFRPNRFRVTLPPLLINGRDWPLKPIEFEYKSDGVGLWMWP